MPVAGLANEKTMHIEAGEENISVTRSHPKHAHRPAQHKAKADKKGKNFRNTSRKLGKEVSSYRPDLKVSLECMPSNVRISTVIYILLMENVSQVSAWSSGTSSCCCILHAQHIMLQTGQIM